MRERHSRMFFACPVADGRESYKFKTCKDSGKKTAGMTKVNGEKF